MIHDIDSTSTNRTNPTPNSSDKVISPMAHQTNSSSYTPSGLSPNIQRMIFKNNMIICYDSENLISSIYGWVTGSGDTPVLIIAQDGKDVFTDVLEIPRPEGL